jgi:hypothetical protein
MNRKHHVKSIFHLILGAAICAAATAQQISIGRIEQMPAKPDPYLMRDWKAVTRSYDSLVFDPARTGTYLPLIFWNTTPINYPSQQSFGLHTYVGDTRDEGSGEAINVVPALTGATLAGVNKRAGTDWVLMSREFFNNRPAENVYLNAPVTSSGDDWWYDVMPNIFFYQLYSLYPSTEDYARQFTSVADRWLEAVYAMRGSITPWSHPGLEHRGWYLATMTPNNQTPHEPEAGGSIGWLLYHAFRVSGNPDYRSGAELCIEELNAYTTNPAYELQLSYGALAAARMNAEIGTEFDVEKIVNWCFEVSPIRSWGAIVGRWGGLDCSGLIGEVSAGNDYAFAMNTFEQVGALVPLVRYDSRFAAAIGRWVLNAANASRLFYGSYLPDANQDSRAWSSLYDPSSAIAHEALRQSGPGGVSPYATGDAIAGGWAPTNLSLYSSSHVGILGAIIDTTDVPGILKLDLLATDYFPAPAYPSFLYYNPDTLSRVVHLPLPSGTYDLYDAVTHQFLLQGVAGQAAIPLNPRAAVVAVLLPAGGTVTYDEEKMLVNGVVADFHSGNIPANHRPRIKALGAVSKLLYLGGTTALYCTAVDRDGDTLTYNWLATGGSIAGSGHSVTWTAPLTKGTLTITCLVGDGEWGDTATVAVTVVDSILSTPVVQDLRARPGKVDLGGSTTVTCRATDPKGFPLSYQWQAGGGTISGTDTAAQWTAPSAAGNYRIICTVSNAQGGSARDSIIIPVRDFSQGGSAGPILFIPFTVSVTDLSGYNNQLTPTNVVLVADRFGTASNAAGFNGSTSCVRVTDTPTLNCDSAITVSLWMKPGIMQAREMFLISHGSWQNRWKLSVIPEGRIRWTVKTTAGVTDIDSRTIATSGVYHHVLGTYNGSDFELYVDGEFETYGTWAGRLLTPAIDLTVGQMLPADASYNFPGVLDDVLIYDYALTYPQVQEVYHRITGLDAPSGASLPQATALGGTYPNPFNASAIITIHLARRARATVRIYDLFGREVATPLDEDKEAGTHLVRFSGTGLASGIYFCRFTSGNFRQTTRMILIR